MQFRTKLISGAFLVLDAPTATVGRTRLLLRARPVPWLVLRAGKKHFVLSTKYVEPVLERARPSISLAAVLRLDRSEPSMTLRSTVAVLDLEREPATETAQSRAVIMRKRKNGELTVFAIGTLQLSVKASTKRAGMSPKHTSARATIRLKGRVIMKAAKKAIARAGRVGVWGGDAERLRIIDRPASAHLSGLGEYSVEATPKRETTAAAHSFTVIDVFYATDREMKSSGKSDHSVRYLNRLPDEAKLSYGICSVTVPAQHKLGKLETPSIWRFQLHENAEKHFTISKCLPRSTSAFFKELQSCINQSIGKTCFVFIHGYNVSFEDAAKKTAQLACDLQFPGAPILYSWASAAHVARYPKDEETVSMTVRRLVEFLARLAEFSGANEIHLIAHSMGNRALVHALDQLAVLPGAKPKPFKQVVLTAPDVPREDVEPLIKAASDKAERVTLYASSKDKALGLSAADHNYERLGKVYGYPFVLKGMDSIDASNVRTDFVAHSVFSNTRTVLGDLSLVIAHGDPPDRRFGLKRLRTPAGVAWTFAP
jgi:esterase/lipase superfamily enzyme